MLGKWKGIKFIVICLERLNKKFWPLIQNLPCLEDQFFAKIMSFGCGGYPFPLCGLILKVKPDKFRQKGLKVDHISEKV